NIAAAVQVISYELYCAATQSSPVPPISTPAEDEQWVTYEAMENLYAHLEQTLVDIAFIEAGKPRNVMRRLRRLFSRTQLDVNEVNILRGILTAVQQRLERVVNRER
ncbi:MAG: tRNA (cytidine32/uridine32-2'-O)-methyltransferase, partial [Halothiobacillaceae bacterium]